MKYRLIQTGDGITVLTEDGGCVEIRATFDGEGRQSTTDYYQSRFTEKDLLSDTPVYEILSEGKMYYNDWDTPFDSPELITDALNWLDPDEFNYELDNAIWPNWRKQ